MTYDADLFQAPAPPQTTPPSHGGEVTLDQMIACVARELKLREIVYPGFVKRGKMKQEEADREHRRMAAVLELLKVTRAATNETETELD